MKKKSNISTYFVRVEPLLRSTLLIIGFWILNPYKGECQFSHHEIPDSILNSLDTLPTTISKLDFLNLTNRELVRRKPELAFKINDYAQVIAEEYQDQNYMGLIKLERGILHSILGDHTSARTSFKDATYHFRLDRDSMRLGYIYRNLAIGFSNEGMQDSALKYCYESLHYLDKDKDSDKSLLTLALNTTANILYRNNAFRASIKYAEAGAELAKETNNESALASAYNIISLSYLELGESGSLHFLEESYRLHVKNQDTNNINISIHNYGLYLIENERYQEALDTLRIGLELSYPLQNTRVTIYYKSSIARALYFLGEYEQAGKILEELVSHYDDREEHGPYGTIFGTLSKIRAKQGRYKEALELVLIAHELDIEGMTLENVALIDIHERDLEYNRKLKHLNYLKTFNELTQKELALKNRNLLLLWILIIGLVTISGLLFYFIRKINYSKAKIEKINRELSEQSIDLKELNQSKENLISIIGHDLRGPLGNLKELLHMIPNEEDVLSEESNNILQLSQGSVEQMNDLLSNLLIWAKSQKRKLLLDRKEFVLRDVVDRVKDLYSSFLSFQNIDLSIQIDKNVMVFADPDTVEIVIRNLVNNSIKYSRPNTNIILSAQHVGVKTICVLEDEAGGIPDKVVATIFNKGLELNVQEASIINGGFGLKLSHELLVANGAFWTYDKTEKGSRITLHFENEPG